MKAGVSSLQETCEGPRHFQMWLLVAMAGTAEIAGHTQIILPLFTAKGRPYRGSCGAVATEESYLETWMPAWPMRQLPMTWVTWPPAWTMRCRSPSCSAVWSLLKGSAAPCGIYLS